MTTRQPGMSLAEFMNHDMRGGGRKKYLTGWKDRPGHALNFWLHPGASILQLWRHPFVRINQSEDKNTKAVTRDVWSDRLVCYEDASLLEEQNFRDRETGVREKPPLLCPICMLIEHLIQLVRDRQLDWRQPLFRFEASDPRNTRIYHVGGFTGLFNNRKMSDAQRAEMGGAESTDPEVNARRARGEDPFWPVSKWYGPIYQNSRDPSRAAFSFDMRAKCEYALSVVDDDKPADGVQVLVEGKLVGEKVQEVLKKSVKEYGEKGDIQRYPYAMRVEYNESENEPSKKYDVLRMSQIARTPAVDQLLFKTAPPDVASLAEKFNLRTIRARLEDASRGLIQLPLDSYFAAALKWEAEQKAAAAAQSAAPPSRAPEVGVGLAPAAPAPAPLAPPPVAPPAALPAPGAPYQPPAPAEQRFSCENSDAPGIMCKALILATTEVCPECGYRYVVHQEAPPPAPAPLPKRSAVAPLASGNGAGGVIAAGPPPGAYAPPPAAVPAPHGGPAAVPAPGGYGPPAAPAIAPPSVGEPTADDDIPF